MTGTIKQDAEGMAQTMVKVLDNYVNGKDGLAGIAKENIEGSRKVNIPYAKYLGDNE
jgi:methyl-galactoside transport system substrate-binding protein